MPQFTSPGPVYMPEDVMAKLSEALGVPVVEAGIEQMAPGNLSTGTFETWITFVLDDGEEVTATARCRGWERSEAMSRLVKQIADRLIVTELLKRDQLPPHLMATAVDNLFFGEMSKLDLVGGK